MTTVRRVPIALEDSSRGIEYPPKRSFRALDGKIPDYEDHSQKDTRENPVLFGASQINRTASYNVDIGRDDAL